MRDDDAREDVGSEVSEADVGEEYEIWKKNCPMMYSRVKEIALDWPSLTFQWLPDSESRALVSTYSNGAEPEEVLIIRPELGQRPEKYVVQQFRHEKEANRLRYSLSDPNYFATFNPDGDVTIYSLTGGSFVLPHTHSNNGYGLSWDPYNPGRLVSGADDSKVVVWQVDFGAKTGRVLNVIELPNSVNDVVWSTTSNNEIAAACENGHVYICDALAKQPKLEFKAHDEGVNSLAYNPKAPHMIATVSSDYTIGLWDLRAPDQSLHVMTGHEASVTNVKWSPHHDGIFATSSQDNRVIIWDISRIGDEQTPEDAEDAVPELLFMHGGHTAPVSDFDWHPQVPWLLGSVAEDNICQVWVPSDAAVGDPTVPKLPVFSI